MLLILLFALVGFVEANNLFIRKGWPKDKACPETFLGNKYFLVSSVVIPYDQTAVAVVGQASRLAKETVHLLLNMAKTGQKGVTPLDRSFSHYDFKEWEDMVVMWTGYLDKGPYIFGLHFDKTVQLNCETADIDIIMLPRGTAVHQVPDNRSGCPPDAAAGKNLIAKTVTVTADTVLEVAGHMVRKDVDEVSSLFLSKDDVYVAQSGTRGDSFIGNYKDVVVHWVGNVKAGKHIFALVSDTDDTFGCGSKLGDLDIIVYPSQGAGAWRQEVCHMKDNVLMRTVINPSLKIFVKITGFTLGEGNGHKVHLRVNNRTLDQTSTFVLHEKMDNTFLHWVGELPAGKHAIDLYAPNGVEDFWCGGTGMDSGIDIIVMDEYDLTGIATRPTAPPAEAPVAPPTLPPTAPPPTTAPPPPKTVECGELPSPVVDCGKETGKNTRKCTGKGAGCVGEGWFSKVNKSNPNMRVDADAICVSQGFQAGASPTKFGGNWGHQCRHPGTNANTFNKAGGSLIDFGKTVTWMCIGKRNCVTKHCGFETTFKMGKGDDLFVRIKQHNTMMLPCSCASACTHRQFEFWRYRLPRQPREGIKKVNGIYSGGRCQCFHGRIKRVKMSDKYRSNARK